MLINFTFSPHRFYEQIFIDLYTERYHIQISLIFLIIQTINRLINMPIFGFQKKTCVYSNCLFNANFVM